MECSGSNEIAATPVRKVGVLHRSAVIVPDSCVVPVIAVTATAAVGGHLEDVTNYNVAMAPGNRYGSAGATNILVQATGAAAPHTHVITLTVPQVVGATFYDIFLSTDAQPMWVGRITEAQRAAGNFQILVVGVVTAGGGAAAGDILVGIVGTGIQTSAVCFAANNSLIIPAGVSYIDCQGYYTAIVHVAFSITDLRSLPSLVLAPLFESAEVPSVFYAGGREVVLIETAAGYPELQYAEIDVSAARKLYLLVAAIGGQGASVNLWVELV